MKTLNLLLCGLLMGCASNQINSIKQIEKKEVPIYYSVEHSEYKAVISIKIQAIIPPRERLDVYYEGNYKIVRCR